MLTTVEAKALVGEFNGENRAELLRNGYNLGLVTLVVMVAALVLVLSVL